MEEGKKESDRPKPGIKDAFFSQWLRMELFLLLLLIPAGISFYFDFHAGCLMLGSDCAALVLSTILYIYKRRKLMQDLIDFSTQFQTLEKEILQELTMPSALLDPEGRLLWMNDQMQKMTGKGPHYHKSLNGLIPDISLSQINEQEENCQDILYGGCHYRIHSKRISTEQLLEHTEIIEKLTGKTYLYQLWFQDITELVQIKKEKEDQTPVVALLYMDNYDEAMDSVEDVRRSMLEVLVDRRITKYVTSAEGICRKLEKDKYFLVLNRKGLEIMRQDRFSILEDVKTVSIGNTIRVTISIGMAVGGATFIQDQNTAHVAIEMALARGGDQVVLRDGDQVQYYGGKSQQTGKNTRVRARVKAQALHEVIRSADDVIVMGHRITDIDSFGACVGVCRAAFHAGKRSHIVLGEINSSIRPWVTLLRDSGDYEEDLFLNHAQAIEKVSSGTVVVVVDTNKPSMVECLEAVTRANTIVVLDHHRQTSEQIERASLSYIEPSASSACEMIAELLQYYDDSVKIRPYEADCIYAGIVIDTNNFMAQTGSRTFEAAAYLRESGADVTRVRKAFRNDMETYKARAMAVREAEAYMGVYAISECPAGQLESPTVIGAQAANELLNIIGVRASFVLTAFQNKIFISARAIDEVNVQIIMERLGGGGHMNIAGAQLPDITIEDAKNRLKELLKQMTEEGAI